MGQGPSRPGANRRQGCTLSLVAGVKSGKRRDTLLRFPSFAAKEWHPLTLPLSTRREISGRRVANDPLDQTIYDHRNRRHASRGQRRKVRPMNMWHNLVPRASWLRPKYILCGFVVLMLTYVIARDESFWCIPKTRYGSTTSGPSRAHREPYF